MCAITLPRVVKFPLKDDILVSIAECNKLISYRILAVWLHFIIIITFRLETFCSLLTIIFRVQNVLLQTNLKLIEITQAI